MTATQYTIAILIIAFILIELFDRTDPLAFWKPNNQDWRKDRPMHFGPARFIASRRWGTAFPVDPLVKVATTHGDEWQANPRYKAAKTGRELDAWMAKRTAQLIAENEAVLAPWRRTRNLQSFINEGASPSGESSETGWS